MSTDTWSGNPSTRTNKMGTNETREEKAGVNNTRGGSNTNPNNLTVFSRVRTKKDKGNQDARKFKGKTLKMNGHVFQLHAERTNKSEFKDTM